MTYVEILSLILMLLLGFALGCIYSVMYTERDIRRIEEREFYRAVIRYIERED